MPRLVPHGKRKMKEQDCTVCGKPYLTIHKTKTGLCYECYVKKHHTTNDTTATLPEHQHFPDDDNLYI